MIAKRRETKKKKHPAGKRRVELRPESGRTDHELLTEAGHLPSSYERTRVVLLPVDPYHVHAYWEIDPKEFEKAQKKLKKGHTHVQSVLRFFDITGIIFDGTNAHGFFDIPVDLKTNNWYVNLWSPEKSYFIELGLETEDGRFLSLGRSNIAETPRAWPPPRESESEERSFVLKDTAVHEAAPLSGREPVSRLIIDSAAEGKPEKEMKRKHKSLSAPVPPADILLRKVTELYRPQSVFEGSFKPESRQMQELFYPRYGKEGDLTDTNEESFLPGISSDSLTSGNQ